LGSLLRAYAALDTTWKRYQTRANSFAQ